MKTGQKVYTIYGWVAIMGQRYSPLGNKSVWYGVDATGNEVDVTNDIIREAPVEQAPAQDVVGDMSYKMLARAIGVKRGQKGEVGPMGPRGIQGLKGDKGDSIKGDKGENGEDGKDGKDGKNGKDGKEGKKGERGERGLTGPKGKDGKDGKDGLNGLNGLNGGGGIHKIDDATDVKITNPTDNQSLTYDAATKKWVNETVSGGSGSGTVDSIVAGNNIDVDATDPANPIVSVEDSFVLNTGDTMTGDLTITSTDTVDGTKRLLVSSYERAVSPTHYGEVIRADWNAADAKVAIAFRDNFTNPGTPVSKGWLLAHDYLQYTDAAYTKSFVDANVNTGTDRITITSHGFSDADRVKLWSTTTLPTGIAHLQQYYAKVIDTNTIELYRESGLTNIINITGAASGGTHYIADVTLGNNPHKHMSLEVTDSTGALQSRLEFPYDKDSTWIKVIDADFVLTGGKKVQMVGENGINKDITFGIDETTVYTRWALRQDSTTESGSNVGSDFKIVRFSDAGVALDSPITIKRSTGLITTSGDVEVNGQNIDLDSPSTASVIIDRNASTNFASNIWRTNGTDQWTAGLRNDSTNNLYIRDNINGVNILQAAQGATPTVTLGGSWRYSNAVVPATSDGAALGSASLMWSDLFLASGGVINFNNGDVTLTHSSNLLTCDGGNFLIGSGFSMRPTTNDGSPLGSATVSWQDLFLANGAVINWNNGNAILTHSAGLLTSSVALSIGTSNALTAGTIELGHATANTLSASSGVLSIEGVVIPTISSTNTLTNKRITKRVITTTDDATAVIDVDVTDDYELTAIANATTFTVTGTPTDGQMLFIRIKDAGVAKALTWTMSGGVIGVVLPTTTVAGKWHLIGFKYFTSTTSWKAIAVSVEA